MAFTHQDTELVAKLARYEKRLEIPHVPGELAGWLDSVHQAASDVASELRRHLPTVHAEVFAVILERDLALAARVEEMKREDMRLIQRAEQLALAFARLAQQCAEKGPDEASLLGEVVQHSGKALSLIINIWKQESAVTTWYMEAFDRDRGIGD